MRMCIGMRICMCMCTYADVCMCERKMRVRSTFEGAERRGPVNPVRIDGREVSEGTVVEDGALGLGDVPKA